MSGFENRIGDHVLSDVVQVEHEWRVVRQLRNRAREMSFEQFTFHRAGDSPPPEIDVPGEYRIIVEGVDYGVRQVCCTGRDPSPGGYLYVKWEA